MPWQNNRHKQPTKNHKHIKIWLPKKEKNFLYKEGFNLLHHLITRIMEENELISLLQKKNEAAFKWLVNTYKDKLYNIVFTILQNEFDAEDVVQDAFIQVFHSIEGFKKQSSLYTWMHTIAIRKALEKMRRLKLKKQLNSFLTFSFGQKQNEQFSPSHQPREGLENKEKAAILHKAIALLPANQRIAFTLIKIEGLSYSEVSATLNVGIKATESLVSRAKANLQKQLEVFR